MAGEIDTYTVRIDSTALLESVQELERVVASLGERAGDLMWLFDGVGNWVDTLNTLGCDTDGTGELLVVLKPGKKLVELIAALREKPEASRPASLADRAYARVFSPLSAEDEAWLATKPSTQEKIKRIPMFARFASPVSGAQADVVIAQLERLIELLERRS